MSRTNTSGFNPIFAQAVNMFDASLKAGLRIQEESVRRFTEMMEQFGPHQDWQKLSREFTDQWIQTVQAGLDESLRVTGQATKTALELMQKSMEAVPAATDITAADQARNLAEAALSAIRTNTQSAVQANARIVEAWSQLARKMGAESNGDS